MKHLRKETDNARQTSTRRKSRCHRRARSEDRGRGQSRHTGPRARSEDRGRGRGRHTWAPSADLASIHWSGFRLTPPVAGCRQAIRSASVRRARLRCRAATHSARTWSPQMYVTPATHRCQNERTTAVTTDPARYVPRPGFRLEFPQIKTLWPPVCKTVGSAHVGSNQTSAPAASSGKSPQSRPPCPKQRRGSKPCRRCSAGTSLSISGRLAPSRRGNAALRSPDQCRRARTGSSG